MKHIFLFSTILLSVTYGYTQGTQLLREPTLSSNKIVFVYADDLWSVEREGGKAIRLTSDIGTESNPHFSPDEKHIAFSAQYEGNTDVYIVPASGGEPQRLTYHPGADIVQGWTPDNKVLFRSGREAYPTHTNKLYSIGISGGFPEQINVPRAAWGEISPDGKQIAYVPITFWDPEWRNYRGGQAMPVWIVDLETMDLTRIPQPTKERHLDPIWYNDEVYFLSERDYLMNIWKFNPSTKDLNQVTFHKDFDIKSLDAGPNGIVYEQGSYLHLLNPSSGETLKLEIHVEGDMNFARVRWEDVSSRGLQNPQISPSGSRAVFEYRGEIFSFPKEEGDWRNISKSPGSAERSPVWSPDGDKLAWFSDESGEYRLVIADQWGNNRKVISLPNPTFYFKPEWSGDGKHIAYSDTDYNIWFVNVSSGQAKKIDTDRYAHPNRSMNPVWSPDSKWLAYAKQLDSHFKAIFVANIETGQKYQVTDGMADAITPVWDEGGKYLYFLASTNYGLNSGWLDMSSYDPGIDRGLYLLLLNKNTPSPFMPETGDESPEKETPSEKEANNKKKGKKSEPVKEENNLKIDIDGIQQRIIPIDVPERPYGGLTAGPENSVYILESVPNERGSVLHKYNLKDRKKTVYKEDILQAVSSFDRKNLLIQTVGGWQISENGKENTLKINARIKIDPQVEYHQIFREGWRYMRDFLYVENLHGAPWDSVWDWYSPWINSVRHRTDLNYVLDIMSGEVAVGHSYVRGGDMPDINRVGVGLTGADFSIENGLYKIKTIYSGESWNPNLNGPLAMPGLDAKAGDYIVSVNGQNVTGKDNIYSFFEETAGRQTQITVQTGVNGSKRSVTIIPISNEYQLRSFHWIESNRKKVDELSGGKLAYVYVPNTGGPGFTYFNRYYFAQQDKKGVVIDERNNGGGSAADYMIDIMNRKLFGYFNSAANDRRPWTTPMAGIWGPKVMIINERAGSGGDLLPYMFKEAKIGPLVGTRTWGGLVGTWDTPPFIDGGRFVAPRGGFYDANGEWAVEGEGISPDIEVIQDPKQVSQGHDPQLEAAVKEAMRLLSENEFILKPEPPAPNKYKRPEKN